MDFIPVLIRSVWEFDYARIAVCATFIVASLCGLLSPLVVLKERSYVGDMLAHFVFPGVVAGYFIAEFVNLPLWVCLFAGAFAGGISGYAVAGFLVKRLRIPQDAAFVTVLSGFFGMGVIAVSKLRGTRVDLDRILFGDVLTLTWMDTWILGGVLALTLLLLWIFRPHWNAWLCDPEFARLSGFRVKLLDIVFPFILTLVVLVSMFAVGGLMISCLLVLPSVLSGPKKILAPQVFLVSLILSMVGLFLSFQLDWPAGASMVVVGLVLICARSIQIYRR